MGDIVEQARHFGRTVLAAAPAPDVETVYDDRHPLWEQFRSADLADWWVPAEYGGRGVGLCESVNVVSELSYHDAGFAFAAFLPILASRMLELYGPEELARRYLAEMATHGSFAAALGSEAEAGSELARTQTTFRRDGDVLHINGDKQFSTNLAFARFCLVLARDVDNPRDFALILVPSDSPGFVVGQRWPMSGLHGTATYPATFTDCVVPAANRLSGNGIRILEVGLDASRILMASIAIGLTRRIRDLSMDYAASKRLGGQPLNRNAVFGARMGQLEMELETMKAQCRCAAAEYDDIYQRSDRAAVFYADGVLKSAIVAKMHCGQVGWRVASRASEAFGGLGYTAGHDIQRCLRDMRHIAIVEGGDDVLRELLYGRYVKRASRRG
ncbi:acyl-CoA dehydrogenase family protein [Nocardia mexicana]|uniref:Alkylation response protein AidB-like acyl-CoA dehydrogenase n=1 Tax=Nocardia mexicana TaxID=279262 RepID=A0A370GPL6_9NOCA|nr:acyl-CoA dehydrogenase family protein [Nocardia mexicana]RDI45250.1 alkylation response protein AidB-like acyl-CoA dehydrogenase [Nocardia mexicana]